VAVEQERVEKIRRDIERQQARLRAQLDELSARLSDLAEREKLLASLTNDERPGPPTDSEAPSGQPVLRGAQLRERAVRLLFLSQGAGRPLYYRDWFQLVRSKGVAVGGKNPLATFLTNVTRSPLVARGSQAGAYGIDPEAAGRIHAELSERQAELRDLTEVIAREVSPSARLQDHRAGLLSEIRRLEQLLAEAERILAPATEEDEDVARKAA
jgi:hypothetical protein